MMKKIPFLFLLLNVIATSPLFSQDPDERSERIKAQRVAFMTQQIGLTPQEAQNFWPVYNEYDEKRNKILVQRRSTTQYVMSNGDNLSEKEAEEIMQRFVNLQKQEASLLEEYNLKFRKILPAKKVMKLYVAEVEFKNYLLKSIKGNKK